MKKTTHMSIQKVVWSLLLFVDVLLFIEALSTNNIGACLLVMVLSEIIYFKGNRYLFGEFDAKRKAKYEERKKNYLQQRANTK
ncbi:hypothetical protein [Lactiplantibacillus herbarum]|uniref:hypothetical protein n=1 Tax=Lactiplantibacillus herbarum TaxID=1670446 RepID=UPI00064F826E|nr:hypothetical protein [Lactiplantibacillus herbarum]